MSLDIYLAAAQPVRFYTSNNDWIFYEWISKQKNNVGNCEMVEFTEEDLEQLISDVLSCDIVKLSPDDITIDDYKALYQQEHIAMCDKIHEQFKHGMEVSFYAWY